ncbi:MAG TPA: CBS domain-containing protein [Nitrososphaera sp.]|jgi:CBS domain-containing protein
MTSEQSRTALIRDYMVDDLTTIGSDASVLEIANRMLENQVGARVVVD